MKRPNITPGKWIKSEKDRHGLWIETNEDEPEEICMVSAATVSYPEFRANIKAIAAVPELLAALEALVRESGRSMDDLDSDVSSHRPLIAAYEALTKAGYEFP